MECLFAALLLLLPDIIFVLLVPSRLMCLHAGNCVLRIAWCRRHVFFTTGLEVTGLQKVGNKTQWQMLSEIAQLTQAAVDVVC